MRGINTSKTSLAHATAGTEERMTDLLVHTGHDEEHLGLTTTKKHSARGIVTNKPATSIRVLLVHTDQDAEHLGLSATTGNTARSEPGKPTVRMPLPETTKSAASRHAQSFRFILAAMPSILGLTTRRENTTRDATSQAKPAMNMSLQRKKTSAANHLTHNKTYSSTLCLETEARTLDDHGELPLRHEEDDQRGRRRDFGSFFFFLFLFLGDEEDEGWESPCRYSAVRRTKTSQAK